MKKTIAIMLFVLLSVVLYSCNSTTEREPIGQNPLTDDGWITYNGTLGEYVGDRKKATSPDNVTAVIINSESLQELHLSADVKTFEIENAPKLKKITVSEENEYFVAINGKLYDKEYADVWEEYLTHPNSADWEISGRFATYIGTSAKTVVPNRVREVLVRDNNTLEEIHISKDVEDVWGGIRGENLKKITIDNENKHFKLIDGILYDKDVTKIASYPDAHPAKKYVVPSTIKELGGIPGGKYTEEVMVHKNCQMGSSLWDLEDFEFITAPENLKKVTVDKENSQMSDIDGVLFNKEQTTLLVYPLGKTETTYTVPSSVTKILDLAFLGSYRYLKTIVMPDDITQIANLSNEFYDFDPGYIPEINSEEDVVKWHHRHLTFIVAENSTTHKTLAEFGLNIEFK